MLEREGTLPQIAVLCDGCGTEIAPGLLTCPGCHRLLHATRLKQLADEAAQAERAGDLAGALAAWREAISKLPPTTRQYEIITERISDLGRQVEASGGVPPLPPPKSDTHANPPGWAGAGAAGVGGLALLVWKFKFLALLVLTKAKFLLLGLTKLSTLLSMFASLSLYGRIFGWQLGAGVLILMYIHEMGHVAALARYGIKPVATLFVPGLGAAVLFRERISDPRQDARVGLAGPLWGTGAILVCLLAFVLTGHQVWGAIAKFSALLNLLNLMPFWQLDGARAFRSLTQRQRWMCVVALGLAWLLTASPADEARDGRGLLILPLLVAVYQAAAGQPAREADRGALLTYVGLVAALSAVLMLPVRV
jgi:Zn-dependent protease